MRQLGLGVVARLPGLEAAVGGQHGSLEPSWSAQPGRRRQGDQAGRRGLGPRSRALGRPLTQVQRYLMKVLQLSAMTMTGLNSGSLRGSAVASLWCGPGAAVEASTLTWCLPTWLTSREKRTATPSGRRMTWRSSSSSARWTQGSGSRSTSRRAQGGGTSGGDSSGSTSWRASPSRASRNSRHWEALGWNTYLKADARQLSRRPMQGSRGWIAAGLRLRPGKKTERRQREARSGARYCYHKQVLSVTSFGSPRRRRLRHQVRRRTHCRTWSSRRAPVPQASRLAGGGRAGEGRAVRRRAMK